MNDSLTASRRPVLVGIGAGSGRQDVVRHAACQARLHRRPLHMLQVTERPEPAGRLPDDDDRVGPSPGHEVVEPLAASVRAEFPGLTVRTETAPGRAPEELLRRSSQAAFLVLGHHEGGGLPLLSPGSVSRQVTGHAECPVIIVRPGESRVAPENRVVAGVDIADISDAALDLAFAEAELRGARLEILHAHFHPGEIPAGPSLVAPDYRALDDAALLILEAETAKRRDRYPEVPVDPHVERVRPATILREASRRAELLVVGSHARSGLRRLMPGSVSGAALHTAECPVAVVPCDAM